jgi:hypothetical protein
MGISVKFVGRYKDLIPMGYTFQKLYGRNHRCYHKGGINDKVWIWQKGSEVEVCDLYGSSWVVADMIIKGTLPIKVFKATKLFKETISHMVIIDRENEVACNIERPTMCSFFDSLTKEELKELDKSITKVTSQGFKDKEESYYKSVNEWDKRYREFYVEDCIIDIIKELDAKGMIRIAKD